MTSLIFLDKAVHSVSLKGCRDKVAETSKFQKIQVKQQLLQKSENAKESRHNQSFASWFIKKDLSPQE